MKKNIILLFTTLLVFTYGCELTNLDKLDSPNNLTADAVEINYALNALQVDFVNMTAGRYADNNQGFNVSAMRACRMLHLFGTYNGPFSDMRSTSSNNLWEWAYMGVLKNADLVVSIAEEGENYHTGIAKVLKAYTMATLVDYFVDVPYTEALDGENNFNPRPDDGAAIYAAALTILDEAIADFNAGTPGGLPNDYFYNNDATRWIKLANSIKLKMHLNMRLTNASASTTAINAIIASGNYISSTADDFQFQFSAIGANPDSRHPEFIDTYGAGGAGSYYMSNYFIWLLKDSKANWDPRIRYYLYRQIDEDPEGDDLPCDGYGYDYCYLGDYYRGRDHADDFGVPPINLERTTWGVYPIGGAFDDDDFASVPNNQGAQGAGIFPGMLSSYVNFMLAEAALTLGTTGDARTYYENGITQSINKVMAFGAAEAAGSPNIPTSTDVDDYIAEALGLYDAAATDTERLDIAMTEYLLALWGNGIELYNMYRRTGMPSTMQSPVIAAGAFPRSYPYPGNLVDRNNNFSQKVVTETVFWDNGSTDLD
ncbi:MAG: SusD/RagB family nutrient-binding outer membrane lipoprotein [Bacteroidetes bacterium]|nr:MAG: SusD/RagB family nutrient-binding outer membrane lipoprotein [Bacteroidota bacterium]